MTNYDKNFYEVLLRKHVGDGTIEVISVDEKPATSKGDNFLSDMTRVRIEYTRCGSGSDDEEDKVTEIRSFIMKHEPAGDSKTLGMVQEQQLFATELRILRDVLPRIENSLGRRIGPKFVYGTDDPPRAVIVMEDLTPKGFFVKDRQRGLSIDHASMAIRNLARFHAGSVALYEENPESLRNFRQGIFNSSTHPNMFVLAVNSLNRLSEDALKWSDEGTNLAAKKLGEIAALVKERVQEVYEYNEDEFCVLNHGDAWVNNMLFTEDEFGRPIEQVYVDYQMSAFSSPAVDLLYFLSINPSIEVRGKGEDALLEIYLEILISSMMRLGCKTEPPTIAQLKDAMHRRRVYAVISGLFLLPRMMLDKEEVEKFDELLKNGTSRINAYEKPETIRMMKRMLPLMSDRGYLDS